MIVLWFDTVYFRIWGEMDELTDNQSSSDEYEELEPPEDYEVDKITKRRAVNSGQVSKKSYNAIDMTIV